MNCPEQSSLVIICGVSGSGKSTALNALEDMGYYCVDNLPLRFLNQFTDFALEETKKSKEPRKFALLVNLLAEPQSESFIKILGKLEGSEIKPTLLYFDSQEYILQRRFKETRRPHPLLIKDTGLESIERAIEQERGLMNEVRLKADQVFDTSFYTPHDLRRNLEEYFSFNRSLSVKVLSFGFKYGAPRDADLVVDVRFLPNPHFVPDLRPRTGLEKEVQDYVCFNGDAEQFLKLYGELLSFVLPKYQNEGKPYLTLAIGCTGGKHRSVTLSERVVEIVRASGFKAEILHRDIGKVS